jgi:hypothetical protein
VITAPLPSNKRPIVARFGSRGNVFTESLPSNGFLRHIILQMKINKKHINFQKISTVTNLFTANRIQIHSRHTSLTSMKSES